jgi:type IX secretion system PorP/SprF family membrane protein
MKFYNKTYFILISLLFPFFFGVAQQDPIVSNYHLNTSLFNPAYSGLYNRFIINTNFRKQWSGLEGSPTTSYLSINSSVIENMVGAGLSFTQDKLGITTTSDFNLLLSYQINLSSNNLFSFGLQGGYTSVIHDQSKLKLKYLDDPDFPQIEQRSSSPNFGVGLALMSDFYYLGISIPRLLNTEFKDGLTNNTIYKRHYYISGSFLKDLTPLFKLKPGALIKYVEGAPMSFDLSANIMYNNQFWFGVFTRDFNTQGAMAQFILNEVYRLGYSIEVPTNSSVGTMFLTHEIVISIDLALFGNQDVYLRYF